MSLLTYCVKDLKEGKKIRISEPDVLKKAGQLFTLRFERFQAFFHYAADTIILKASVNVSSWKLKGNLAGNFSVDACYWQQLTMVDSWLKSACLL